VDVPSNRRKFVLHSTTGEEDQAWEVSVWSLHVAIWKKGLYERVTVGQRSS
jgi:hypothetical protein